MPYVYADKTEILRRCDARIVVQLTNDDEQVDPNDLSSIDETVLMTAENDAAQTVDNFLRYVYEVPLSGATLTPEIKGITASLTWCMLWERRGEESEQVKALRERTFKRLEAMSKQDAAEVRGARSTASMAIRIKKGKAITLFDRSGYFDGLRIAGTRQLPGDREGTGV
jgi:phage gp36-like protein